MNDRVALLPGSFDPLTNGHLDIIERGLLVFDRLIVGIAHNSRKQTLFTVDEREVLGFTIAGEDQRWHHAQAKLSDDGKTIEVWSDDVAQPVAVRYGWADNPICNVYSRAGLPLTPFRTDDWAGITANAKTR